MNQFLHSCLHSVPQTLQRWLTGVYPPLVFNLVFFTNTQLFLSGVWLTRSPHAHSVIVTWGFVLFTACLFRVLQWIDVNRRGKIKLMFSRSEVSNISVNPGGSVCGLLWTSKDAGNTYFNQDTFWSRRICNVCEFNYIVWFFFFLVFFFLSATTHQFLVSLSSSTAYFYLEDVVLPWQQRQHF